MIRLFIVFASLCLILSPLSGLAKSSGKRGGKNHRTISNQAASPSASAYEHASDNSRFKRGDTYENGAGGKGKQKGKDKSKSSKGENKDSDLENSAKDKKRDRDRDKDQSDLNEDSTVGGKQQSKQKQKGAKQE